MELWRSKALELLPEIRKEILECDNPMGLWIEVHFAFDEAYEEPKNDNFIRRVYAFEKWSLDQHDGTTAADHLPSCVTVAFWERIPTNPKARADMPRWFSVDAVIANGHFFKYFLSDEDFEELIAMYEITDLQLEPR